MPNALRDAIKKAASDRVWSQGVLLAREDRVTQLGADANETSFEVRLPTRPVPFTVHLSMQHGEWECDCPSRDVACAHVVAAVVVWSDGTVKDAATRGGHVGYRLTAAPSGIAVARVIVGPTGEAAIGAGGLPPDARPSEVDVRLDTILHKHPTLTADRYGDWLRVLAEVTDITWDGKPVRIEPAPVLPRLRLVDEADEIVLYTESTLAEGECVAAGLMLKDGVLRPLGETHSGGLRWERFPLAQRYRSSQWPRLPSMLAEWNKTQRVDVETIRLPRTGKAAVPRISMEVEEAGDRISVLPLLVYGDPPRARIDAGELVHLSGDVPLRDPGAEKQLLLRLRDELNMVPGRRITMVGADARELSRKLSRWLRTDAAAATASIPLRAHVVVEGTRLVARFVTDDGVVADTTAVLRAWGAQADVVSLPGGGWGRVPMDWLGKNGHLLADLLAARAGDRVPLYLMPDVGRLCESLAIPPPPELSRLRPLLEGGIPRAELPVDVTATLRPYQQVGVDWLVFCRDAGLGSILADDMGLGKTLEAMCAFSGRTLVVSPTSVLFNWRAELAKFRPGLSVHTYHGAKRTLQPADVTLTTYALLRSDQPALSQQPWDIVVLDEAHAIKNPDSQVARAAYAIPARWRVSMSGTPIENRLDELWSQFHFTNPGFFGSRHDFLNEWEGRVGRGDDEASYALRTRIRPFMMRRKKQEVAPELPPRTEMVQYIELSDDERARYDAVRAASQDELVSVYEKGGVMAALEALLRLRQAACHPALLPGVGADSSSKVETLVEMLQTLVAEGHKALVFSQWTSFLDLIEKPLRKGGLRFSRLDGTTTDRERVVTTFSEEKGPPILLLSLKAGGVGLNLVAADHVFLCDPWWNPAAEDQAADRAHRIGQDKPVTVVRLVSRGTVEEKVLELQARKRAIAAAALDGGIADGITRAELLSLLE